MARCGELKRHLAHVTLKGPYVEVDSAVTGHGGLVSEQPVAHVTLIRLLQSVRPHVGRHVLFLAESLAANATSVRLLARVHLIVLAKAILRVVLHATNATLEFSGALVVSLDVVGVGRLKEEFAFTYLALDPVVVGLRVLLQVNVEVGFVTVRLAAEFAHVGFLTSVDSHVTRQVVSQFELLVAEVAFEALLGAAR